MPAHKDLRAPIFERQPREPDRAWAAYVAYRDLGPNERSLSRVASDGAHGQKDHLGKSCSKWRWVERCNAWDEYVDMQKRLAYVRESTEMGRRQAVEATAMQRALIEPVRVFLDRLQDPMERQTLAQMDLALLWQMSAHAARLYPLVAKLEQHARGITTEHLEQTRAAQGDELAPASEAYLDDAERMAAVFDALADAGVEPAPRQIDSPVIDVEAEDVA